MSWEVKLNGWFTRNSIRIYYWVSGLLWIIKSTLVVNLKIPFIFFRNGFRLKLFCFCCLAIIVRWVLKVKYLLFRLYSIVYSIVCGVLELSLVCGPLLNRKTLFFFFLDNFFKMFAINFNVICVRWHLYQSETLFLNSEWVFECGVAPTISLKLEILLTSLHKLSNDLWGLSFCLIVCWRTFPQCTPYH